MWAYDFASAAIVIRAQLALARATEMPVLRMGTAGILYVLAVNTFWAPVRRTDQPALLDLIQTLANLGDAVQLGINCAQPDPRITPDSRYSEFPAGRARSERRSLEKNLG